MYRLLLLPLAKEDIKRAAIWYAEKQPNLGKLFLKKVREKAAFIAQNPTASAVRYDETRCAILGTYPFMIHFLVDENAKTILVLAVFHTSQNPQKWKKR